MCNIWNTTVLQGLTMEFEQCYNWDTHKMFDFIIA